MDTGSTFWLVDECQLFEIYIDDFRRPIEAAPSSMNVPPLSGIADCAMNGENGRKADSKFSVFV